MLALLYTSTYLVYMDIPSWKSGMCLDGDTFQHAIMFVYIYISVTLYLRYGIQYNSF